jgi:NADH-quinone oxidoreductase subunit J
MLDIDFAELRSGFQRYAPVGLAVGVVLAAELFVVLGGWKLAPEAMSLRFAPNVVGQNNTAQLGRLIYTDYVLLFQTAGLVLLVAMIGAIVLTLRDRRTSRHQDIARQIARTPADTLEMVDVRIGAGMTEIGIRRPKVEAPPPAVEHAHDAGHGGH